MIDLEEEKLLSPTQAARHPAFAGPDGGPCHVASVYRVIQRGRRDAAGNRIRLETIRTPRGLRTSVEAVGRFVDALNADADVAAGKPVGRAAARANAKAKGDLAAAGW